MTFSNISFSQLRTLLLDLGFVEGVIEGKYLGFYHKSSDSVFPFRMYGPQDRVSRADLMTVRSQLDYRGLLSEEAFDASLRKASA